MGFLLLDISAWREASSFTRGRMLLIFRGEKKTPRDTSEFRVQNGLIDAGGMGATGGKNKGGSRKRTLSVCFL